MKISVIIPVYNRFEYVENIIKCLMKQTVQPDEIIFADDGSSENLKEVLEKYKKIYNIKMKHVYQEDRGFRKSKSCNNAVLESEGDYLIFLDQDAVFPESLISDFSKRIEKNRFSILRVLWSTLEEKEKIQSAIDNNKNYVEWTKEINNKEKWELKKYLWRDKYKNFRFEMGWRESGTGLMGIGFALWKEDYIKVNGYDEEFQGWGGEDADLGHRLYSMGLKSKPFGTAPQGVHMCHPLDKTKVGDKNKGLEEKKRKDINKSGYKCTYGIDNRKEIDGYSLVVV